MSFSSLSSEERFWAKLAILVAAIAILAMTALAWFLFQVKTRVEHPDQPAAVSDHLPGPNGPNSLDPAVLLFSAGTNAPTNLPALLPPPAGPSTNSN